MEPVKIPKPENANKRNQVREIITETMRRKHLKVAYKDGKNLNKAKCQATRPRLDNAQRIDRIIGPYQAHKKEQVVKKALGRLKQTTYNVQE